MRALVTGGTGFVGDALVRALVARGDQVRVLARATSKTEALEALGVDINQGAIVSQVGANSPAAKAGLRAGDIITAIDGVVIFGASDVRNKIGLLRVGDRVEITVLRDGEVIILAFPASFPHIFFELFEGFLVFRHQ